MRIELPAAVRKSLTEVFSNFNAQVELAVIEDLIIVCGWTLKNCSRPIMR